MKKYNVEFNTSGFYSGAGSWEGYEEFNGISAESAQEAIEIAITWYCENSVDYKTGEEEVSTFAWRAAEIKIDCDGFLMGYEWENLTV